MNKRIGGIILGIFLLSLVARGDDMSQYYTTYMKYIEDYTGVKALPTEPHYFVIIDNDNCSGCISDLVHMVKKYIGSNKKASIIFSYSSRIKPDILSIIEKNHNLFIDGAGKFHKMNYTFSLGLLIYTEKNQIISSTALNIENDKECISGMKLK